MRRIAWKARLFNLARSAAHGMRPLLKRTGLEGVHALQALRHKGKQQMIRWLESGNLVLIETDGHAMYIYNRPHFIGVHLSQPYESYTSQLFKDAVKPGATVLDIGANIGYFTLAAARRAGADGKVYAFEPGPDNFRLLVRNIELNEFANVTAIPKAVGNESKTVTLTLAEDSDQHSLFAPPMVASTGTIPVECVALDDFLQGLAPDVIKLDVEGNELPALDGMRKTLAKSKSLVMFVELNPVCLRQAGAQAEDLIFRLRDLDFELHVINEESRSLSSLTDDYLRQIRTRRPGWFANLYCAKNPALMSASGPVAKESL
jgi:FkbM family methyltransferase